jgi:hypothetical protein
MTIEQLKKLNESEDKVEFKEGRRNYPFNGGSHKEQADLYQFNTAVAILLALADAMEVRPKLFDCKPIQVKK